MKTKKKILIISSIGFLIIIVGVVFVINYLKNKKQIVKEEPEIKFPPLATTSIRPIPTGTISQGNITSTLTSSPTISPQDKKSDQIQIIGGKIKEINYKNKTFIVTPLYPSNEFHVVLTDQKTTLRWLICPKNGGECQYKEINFSELKINDIVTIFIREVKNENTILAGLVEVQK